MDFLICIHSSISRSLYLHIHTLISTPPVFTSRFNILWIIYKFNWRISLFFFNSSFDLYHSFSFTHLHTLCVRMNVRDRQHFEWAYVCALFNFFVLFSPSITISVFCCCCCRCYCCFIFFSIQSIELIYRNRMN